MSLVRNDFNFQGVNFECWALVMPDGSVFFKLKELAKVLGYANALKAHRLIDDDLKLTWTELVERENLQSLSLPPSNWHPSTIFVPEEGLYSLVFRSHKPEAKRFSRHVMRVILPEIRKKGGYIAPTATASQLNSLIESLREQQAEKERTLTETREELAETRGILEEKERTLAETRGLLEESQGVVVEKDRMLEVSRVAVTESQAAAAEKDRLLNETQVMLGTEMHEKSRLQNNLQTVRPKVAIIPDRDSLRHTLSIYRHGNTYRFIRTQKRSLWQARSRVPERFRLARYFDEVPNALNIVNRLKEVLPQNAFRNYNTIRSDAPVVQLVEQILENEINRPIRRNIEE